MLLAQVGSCIVAWRVFKVSEQIRDPVRRF